MGAMMKPQPGQLLDRDGLPLFTLRDVNALPIPEKERVYGRLLPASLGPRFGIDPESFLGNDGERKVRFICPEGIGLLRIEVRLQPGDRDCLFFVELADTPFGQMELSFCLNNDPDSPRFDIDQDTAGRDNFFGTLRRNLSEELKAMQFGLAPNQVRRGLHLFGEFFTRLETFVAALGIQTILGEPLSYGNAIRFERYGFDYLTGKQLMLWIDQAFKPGGELYRRLDGSSPFRKAGMGNSVVGRSWAIHDGILQRSWDGIRIYKVPGVHAGIDTLSGRETTCRLPGDDNARIR
jgi:hypothetical protein